MTRPTIAERWFASFTRDPSSGCYLWHATRRKNDGYGQFYADGVNHYAHRYSYEMVHGPVPPGLYVLHSPGCISRACINASHLRAGTQKENMADSVAIGTQRTGPTPKVFSDPEQALMAQGMAALGATAGEIARAFGVSVGPVYSLLRGHTWQEEMTTEVDRALAHYGPSHSLSAEDAEKACRESVPIKRVRREGRWDAGLE